jgi:hypothetical protein
MADISGDEPTADTLVWLQAAATTLKPEKYKRNDLLISTTAA